MKKWYQKSLRRNLIDMHIHGWDSRFLSKLDSNEYVRNLVTSRVKTALVYANSHVGYCYWPTMSGTVHPSLAGQDFLRDLIDKLQSADIDVELYYSLIFNSIEAEKHESWRQVSYSGESLFGLRNRRYGICCPNNPEYRTFVEAQVSELLNRYSFVGVWFDMTFWPEICACYSCQKRYKNECDREIPTVIDWRNEDWVHFQRTRERWISDFGEFASGLVKNADCHLTVAHQGNAFLSNWKLCGCVELAKAGDFMSADLYGDSLRHSFSSKVFYTLSTNLPFEYMTSRCPDLRFHTTTKSSSELELQAMSAIANGGGFLFIDAMNPDGTLDERVYENMNPIYSKISELEPVLCKGNPIMRREYGVYMSMESRVPLHAKAETILPGSGANNPFSADAIFVDHPSEHAQSVLACSKMLMSHHIPYGVVLRNALVHLGDYSVVLLANAAYLDDVEIEALRHYVSSGGVLFAAGEIATMNRYGRPRTDGRMASLLGVSLEGYTDEQFTYIRPADGNEDLFIPYSATNPVGINGQQLCLKVHDTASTLGYLTLPFNDPSDRSLYSSIHSNPPGRDTNNPAVVLNEYGEGRVIYCSALPDLSYDSDVVLALLEYAKAPRSSVVTDAPGCVEVTVFDDAVLNRSIVHTVNFQSQLPPVPVHNAQFELRIPWDGEPRARNLLTGMTVPVSRESGRIRYSVERIETYAAIEITCSR